MNNIAISLPGRFRRTLALHGPAKTGRLFLEKVGGLLKRRRPDLGAGFDLKHGTDTCGAFVPDEREVKGANWRFGVGYRGVDAEDFQHSFDHLRGDLSRYSFVDFGCGKGRALILAWQMGFTMIHGVEYSRKLCAVAEANCLRLGVPATVTCADAATYALPAGPLVVFMYNPFGAEPMAAVARNLQAACCERGQSVDIVYRNPEQRAVWQGQDWLVELRNEMCLAVFNGK